MGDYKDRDRSLDRSVDSEAAEEQRRPSARRAEAIRGAGQAVIRLELERHVVRSLCEGRCPPEVYDWIETELGGDVARRVAERIQEGHRMSPEVAGNRYAIVSHEIRRFIGEEAKPGHARAAVVTPRPSEIQVDELTGAETQEAAEVAGQLKQQVDATKTNVLEAVIDFQSVLLAQSIGEAKGLPLAIAEEAVDAAVEIACKPIVDAAEEALGPAKYVLTVAQVAYAAVTRNSAEEEERERKVALVALIKGIVNTIKTSAIQTSDQVKAAIEQAQNEHPRVLLGLRGSPLLTRPFVTKAQAQMNIAIAYEKALRQAGLRTVEQQIREHDVAHFEEAFGEQEKHRQAGAKQEEP